MEIMTVSVVNFRAQYGRNAANAQKIAQYARAAAAQGADLVVFPEMALTGYDNEYEVPKAEKMQLRCAEPVPGPSTSLLEQTARELKIYIAFGMPELDCAEPGKVYNSAVVLGPNGLVCSHRKTHIGYPESEWAAKGDHPTVFETPWGLVGLAICYEIYRYPEFIRYARAKGARLFLNCTAASRNAEPASAMRTSLEASALQNHMFIASSNLTGLDQSTDFFGGSNIIGPSFDDWPVRYYAGVPFDHPDAKIPGVFTATLDLTEVENNMFMYRVNPAYGEMDFRPALFAQMYQDLVPPPT